MSKIFSLATRDYYDTVQCTWKNINYRKIKGKPNDLKNFCKGTIRAIRENLNNKLLSFFLIENHSPIFIQDNNHSNKNKCIFNSPKSSIGNDLDNDKSLTLIKPNINDNKNIKDNIIIADNETNDNKNYSNNETYNSINSMNTNINDKDVNNENNMYSTDFLIFQMIYF